MRALVVFESMFGNTHRIADAVAAGVGRYATVTMVPVDDAPTQLDTDLDLLVVGGPTHVHGLSSLRSRQVNPKLAAQGAVQGRIGVREWLTALTGPAVPAAAFDTRFRKPRWLTGSAAVHAARLLRKRGSQLARPPESFFVGEGAGPLLPGELDRARAWGEQLGKSVAVGGRVG
jgi:hypothetical protein